MDSVVISFSCLCQLSELMLLKQSHLSAIKGGFTIYWWAFLLYNKLCFSWKAIHCSLSVFLSQQKRGDEIVYKKQRACSLLRSYGLSKEAERDVSKCVGYPNEFSAGY